MPNLSLGTIEVFGLPAAVEAADVACKTADVKLIGYESTDGMGMVAVKIEGQVSAVQAAVAAAAAAAASVTKVFATSVIARPSDQLEPVVLTELTVGLAKPEPKALPEPEPAPEPPAEPAPEPPAEPVEVAAELPAGPNVDDVEPAGTAPEPLVEPVATIAEPTPKPRAARSRTPRSTKKQ